MRSTAGTRKLGEHRGARARARARARPRAREYYHVLTVYYHVLTVYYHVLTVYYLVLTVYYVVRVVEAPHVKTINGTYQILKPLAQQ